MLPMVRHLALTLKRMSVVFIVSDFVTGDNALESPELAQLAAKHDLVAIVPRIATRPGCRRAAATCRCATSNRPAGGVGLGRQARAGYAAAVTARHEALARAFYRVPMDHVFVPTTGSPVLPVLSLFARRKA